MRFCIMGGLTNLMKTSARHMGKLTRQILAYAGEGKYESQIISLNDVVESTLSVIEHKMPGDIGVATQLTKDNVNAIVR